MDLSAPVELRLTVDQAVGRQYNAGLEQAKAELRRLHAGEKEAWYNLHSVVNPGS